MATQYCAKALFSFLVVLAAAQLVFGGYAVVQNVPDWNVPTVADGNLADPGSRVSKLKHQVRDYSVLEFLLTKPRLTYLARVRNPNPAMPDYHESPLSLQEYKVKNADPFQAHGAAQEPAGAAHGAEKGGH